MNEGLLRILKQARMIDDEGMKNSFIEAAIIMLEEVSEKSKPAGAINLGNPFRDAIKPIDARSKPLVVDKARRNPYEVRGWVKVEADDIGNPFKPTIMNCSQDTMPLVTSWEQ